MPLTSIQTRPANASDLDAINALISLCVMGWDLPERVKRLSIGSYQYNELDLQHLHLFVALDSSGHIVGVVALEEADTSELPGAQTGLLLHGLYTSPDNQRQGIGKKLLKLAFDRVRDQQLNGLLVKAQADANSYFQKQGFSLLPVVDHNKDYPHRWWKPAV